MNHPTGDALNDEDRQRALDLQETIVLLEAWRTAAEDPAWPQRRTYTLTPSECVLEWSAHSVRHRATGRVYKGLAYEGQAGAIRHALGIFNAHKHEEKP